MVMATGPAPAGSNPSRSDPRGWTAAAGVAFAVASAGSHAGAIAFHLVAGSMLGPGQYGAVGALTVVLGWLAVPVVAVETLLTAAVARHAEGGHRVDTATAGRRSLLIGGAVAMLLLAAGPAVSRFLRLGSPWPMVLVALCCVPMAAGAVPWAVLCGQRRFPLVGAGSLVSALLRVALAVVFLSAGWGVTGAVAAVLCAESARSALMWWYARPTPTAGVPAPPLPAAEVEVRPLPAAEVQARPLPAADVEIPPLPTANLKIPPLPAGGDGPPPPADPALGLGVREAVTATGAVAGLNLLLGVDAVLAQHLLPAHQAGLYVAATTACRFVFFAAQAACTLALPRFGLADAGHSRRAVLAAGSAAAAIGLLSTLALAVAAPPFLAVGLGPDFRLPVALLVLRGLGTTVLGLLWVSTQYLLSRGSRGGRRGRLGTGLAVLATVAAGTLYHPGPVGLAASTTVGIAVAALPLAREVIRSARDQDTPAPGCDPAANQHGEQRR